MHALDGKNEEILSAVEKKHCTQRGCFLKSRKLNSKKEKSEQAPSVTLHYKNVVVIIIK